MRYQPVLALDAVSADQNAVEPDTAGRQAAFWEAVA